jgi:hypothetical protein
MCKEWTQNSADHYIRGEWLASRSGHFTPDGAMESGLLVSGDGKHRTTTRNILITDGNAIPVLESRQSVTTEVSVISTSIYEY